MCGGCCLGVLHNLARGLHGDLAALVRAGAIVAGLPFTATGFLKIRVLVALLAAGENRLRSPAATPTPVPPR